MDQCLLVLSMHMLPHIVAMSRNTAQTQPRNIPHLELKWDGSGAEVGREEWDGNGMGMGWKWGREWDGSENPGQFSLAYALPVRCGKRK